MTEDRYIKWIQVLPGAVKIDHHIIVLAHQPESPIAPLIEERNRGDRNNNNVNNGGGAAGNAAGAGVGRVAVAGEKVARLAEYARGNDGDIYDDNEGMLLQAGAIISFEFHYHPNGESEAVDATKVGIKFWPRGYKPKHLVSTRGISSAAFATEGLPRGASPVPRTGAMTSRSCSRLRRSGRASKAWI